MKQPGVTVDEKEKQQRQHQNTYHIRSPCMDGCVFLATTKETASTFIVCSNTHTHARTQKHACWYTAGVGIGEFARLVPREPNTDATKDTHGGDAGEEAGGDEEETRGNAGKQGERSRLGGAGRDGGASAGAAQQQYQLLNDLVPLAGRENLPGKGIDFVDDSGAIDADATGKRGERGAGDGGEVAGSGRVVSKFERQALQKARARQRERMEAGEPQVSNIQCSCWLLFYGMGKKHRRTEFLLP